MQSTRPFIRAILIDLSGTLHIGSSPTPDAVRALRGLRCAGIPFRFCSNTSKESTSDLCDRLAQMGFEISSELGGSGQEVWTSVGALKKYLTARGLEKPYFLLSESARNEISEPASPDPQKPYDSVVIGLAPSLFTYEHLNAAFRILAGEQHHRRTSRKLDIPLIATHKAKYIEAHDGALSLGPGPFVAALEEASGTRAEIVGKPNRKFFETVISSFKWEEEAEIKDESGSKGRIAVIGDDVEADLGGGAVDLGLWRILVKTGKYRPGDESRTGVQPPDELWDSFAAFVDDLLTARSDQP